MQTEEEAGRLVRELRPSWHLYGTYAALTLSGAGTVAWLLWSQSPWRWILLLTGLAIPTVVVAAALGLWGLLGAASLARNCLRLHEKGLYQGPRSGRKGVFLPYAAVRALEWDVVRFPQPLPPLVGHYRITGDAAEILLYPKLYPDIESVAAEIASRTGLDWTEIGLSRHAH